MKYFLAVIIAFILTQVQAQYYDSVSFVNADWSVHKIGHKMKLYRFHFNNKNLFRSNQYISYVIIKTKPRRYEFDVAAEPQQLRTVSDFAQSNNALAAVNGNFFDVKNGGAVDFTKVDNRVININRKDKGEKRSFNQKAAVVVSNGKLSIKKWNGTGNWEEELEEPDIMLNGPLLIWNGNTEPLDSNSFNRSRHPRTCVGITKKGRAVMLVADGRNSNSEGLNLFELAKIMRWLGCVSAINFDGGGSSTLWVKDEGVINYPSDNRKWEHEGERKVANILYVKKRN